jgi:hypothetical protein
MLPSSVYIYLSKSVHLQRSAFVYGGGVTVWVMGYSEDSMVYLNEQVIVAPSFLILTFH